MSMRDGLTGPELAVLSLTVAAVLVFGLTWLLLVFHWA
jgi:hypothetical protein